MELFAKRRMALTVRGKIILRKLTAWHRWIIIKSMAMYVNLSPHHLNARFVAVWLSTHQMFILISKRCIALIGCNIWIGSENKLRGKESEPLPEIERFVCGIYKSSVKYLNDHVWQVHKLTEMELEEIIQQLQQGLTS